MVEFRILGPVEFQRDATLVPLGGHRQVALLAYLLLTSGESVTAERVADALWPGGTGSVKRLHVAVTRLRKALGPEVLRSVPGGYRLVIGSEELDRNRFERGVEAGRSALAAGRFDEASDVLASALALWRGPPLADVSYESFAQADVSMLEEARLAAIELKMEAELRAGRHSAVAAQLEGLAARHPEREQFAAQLMLSLYRCGRQAEALEVFRRVRAHFAEDLGLEPGPVLQRLQVQILSQSPELDLPGAGRPLTVDRAPRRAPALPVPAAPPGTNAFVGRRSELERLEHHLSDATGGVRLVVVSGEAGIGKTRLIHEFLASAEGSGARVLYGLSDRDGVLPYQPFVEALRQYVPQEFDRLRRDGWEAQMAELGRMIPEIRGAVAERDESSLPELQRFRLFEAVVSVLIAAAEERPVVLVLDDLQWADEATVQLLHHLLREARFARLLVVVAHHPRGLAERMTRLGHECEVHHLALSGLASEATRELVRARMPSAPARLVDRLADETDGNPFFLDEILRNLLEAGEESAGEIEDLRIPDTVTSVVEERLARLDPTTVTVLRVASVAGRQFDLELLEQVCDVEPEQVLDAVDEAFAADLLIEERGRRDTFRFSHALVRATLYNRRSRSWRRRMHLRIGQALERSGEAHPGRVAHHFYSALPLSGPEAVGHLESAGRAADAALAWEDAALWYRLALDALDLLGSEDAAARGRLLLAQGAAFEHGGESEDARQTYQRAASLARRTGDSALLARAALGYGQTPGPAEGADDVLLALLEEARSVLPGHDRRLSALVLARLAVERSGGATREQADELSRAALRLAEGVGDDVALAVVLASRHWTLCRPGDLAERCAVAQRSLEHASRAQDLDRTLAGRQWWLWDLLELGYIDDVVAQLAEYDALADRLGNPSYRGFSLAMHAMLELLRGDGEAADQHSAAACALLERAGDPDAHSVRAFQRFAYHLQRGEPEVAAAVVSEPLDESGVWPCLQAWALSESGDLDAARSHVVPLDQLSQNRRWLASVTALAHTAAALEDADLARCARDALAPYTERTAAIEGTVCFGSVAHAEGVAAGALGERGSARRLLELAMAADERIGARPWVELVRRDLEDMSRFRRRPRPDGDSPDGQTAAARQGNTSREGTRG